MLSVYRAARGCFPSSGPLITPSSRYFASVVETVTTQSAPLPPPGPTTSSDTANRSLVRSTRNGRKLKRAGALVEGNTSPQAHLVEGGPLRPHLGVEVDPNHGLYAFFRKKVDKDGQVQYESIEAADMSADPSGRSWTAAELRRKSFRDLHTLWYVLLRERNLLATQKEEARRIGAGHAMNLAFPQKLIAVRKSMARIKYVLNERRRAYVSALELQNRLLAKQAAERQKRADLLARNETIREKWRQHAALKAEEEKIREEEERVRKEEQMENERKRLEAATKAAASMFGEVSEQAAQDVKKKDEKDTKKMDVKRDAKAEAKGKEKVEDKKVEEPLPMEPPEDKALGDRVAAQLFGFDERDSKR
ncbi:MRP-L47-domain-containing protein [Gloeophyllum trabeum ATCC 11539]|uniref:Large ribosomal subunit protein uL29m n=1 Tax=Gloeophyllum trabeum (strain ATCC 11539 / FP-39264 / Madison 617) TaxID=670483 RepID=S7Q355_GLOTA|nr:MRP-L47-domain-containing protein [Gloeophyllum trabeum ATCC 11539]EPQ54446.1 MRP-L47-domain-containing protein [Gloeophyllum trabeum ATCC 11539]